MPNVQQSTPRRPNRLLRILRGVGEVASFVFTSTAAVFRLATPEKDEVPHLAGEESGEPVDEEHREGGDPIRNLARKVAPYPVQEG